MNLNVSQTINSSNHSIDWSIFDKYYRSKRNATREGEDDDVSRFFLINTACVVIIMFSMSLCYMSHVFYNKWWKAFKSRHRRVSSVHSDQAKILEVKDEKKQQSMKNSYKKKGKSQKVTIESEQEAGTFI